MRKAPYAGKGLLLIGSVALSAYLLLHLTFHLQKSAHTRSLISERRWYPASFRSTASTVDEQPLIPRIIHQTYKSRDLSKQHRRAIQSWRQNNPLWAHRFYDDAACEEFVAAEFPQWLSAYRALPLAVEQADFFRYLVILRHGGVYADVDTECGRPLDDFLVPSDSLVAGWEDEYATPEMALKYRFARQRQLEQWVFAAEPNHPALQALCERVAANAYLPYNNSITDALFRTGPGPFTDEILKFAMANEQQGSYRVRILPRVTLGGLPGGKDGMELWEEPQRLVAHLHMGSWKSHSFKRKARLLMDEGSAAKMLHAPTGAELQQKLYPVSVTSRPPFTVMTCLKGQDMAPDLAEAAAQITTWGTILAPGAFIMKRPVYLEFFDAWQDQSTAGQGLLDIGAGIGFTSLAAAAHNFTVEAFEAEHSSLLSLHASVAYNGFTKNVKIHQPPAAWTKALASRAQMKMTKPVSLCNSAPVNASKAAVQLLSESLQQSFNASVGAIRMNLHGLEGQALQLLKEELRKPSLQVILLEAYPQMTSCSGSNQTLQQMLTSLRGIGFTSVLHMGNVCMRMKTQGLWRQDLLAGIMTQLSQRSRRIAEQSFAAEEGFQWCTYSARSFEAAGRYVSSPHVPEVFLIRKVQLKELIRK